MSNLSATLSKMLERKQMSAADLSRVTGIDRATISRWKNGAQLSLSDENLKNIAEALAKEPAEQAELVRARMLDLCRGPGSDLIQVRIESRALKETGSAYDAGWPPMPPKIERALKTIARHTDQSEVRDMVQSMADLLEPKKK